MMLLTAIVEVTAELSSARGVIHVLVERNDAVSSDALSQQQDHEPQTKAVQITLQSADASHKKRSGLQFTYHTHLSLLSSFVCHGVLPE